VATGKCGKTTVEYDSAKCSFSCKCTPGSGCTWSVTCGDVKVSGTGLVAQPPSSPSVTIAGGTLAMCAKNLEGFWNRRVIVPPQLRTRRVRRRTLSGSPEEIAEALGLRLGPKRAGR
jgi:hypothetical protein